MSIRHIAGALMLPVVMTMTGCATIAGHPTQVVPIASTPSGAHIVIKDEAGLEVYTGETPAEVTLQKHNGNYWGGKHFTVVITKDGYKPQEIHVDAHANGLYISNLFFFGPIGWFAVDPLNGNMYTLSPDTVSATLDAGKSAHNNTSKDGIQVVLLQDVPANLRDKLVKIN